MRKHIFLVGMALSTLAVLAVAPFALAAPLTPKTASATQPFSVTGTAGTITSVASTSFAGLRASGMKFYTMPAIYQSMTDAQYYLVRGQLEADGNWHYKFTVHMAKGVLAESVEIGQNAQTQTEVVAIGVQPQTNIRPTTSCGTADAASVWYDPLNLQLVQVFDYNSYCWNGSCVTSASEHFPGTILYPDGWYTASESHSHSWGCGETYAYTTGEYVNAAFCSFITGVSGNTTFAGFDPAGAVGIYDGARGYSADAWTSGGCTSFLHWGQHWNA